MGTWGLVLAAVVALSSCTRPPPDATPDGAVRLWLEKMEESGDDPKAAREAYALLGAAARANLEERALRSTQVTGRRADPHEMLAVGRFGLRFRPKAMKANIMGDRATVEVTGDEPLLEDATVRCSREPGGWRVEPDLPDVAPLPRRGDGGG